jgi:hypothetical protein
MGFQKKKGSYKVQFHQVAECIEKQHLIPENFSKEQNLSRGEGRREKAATYIFLGID